MMKKSGMAALQNIATRSLLDKGVKTITLAPTKALVDAVRKS